MNEGIINEEASVEKGENARMASFVGAIAIADLVKSTLGPKGMDKILQSVSSKEGKIEVTNDGATILRSVHIDNAAAKVLVDIAKTQDEEVGDGALAASRRVHETRGHRTMTWDRFDRNAPRRYDVGRRALW